MSRALMKPVAAALVAACLLIPALQSLANVWYLDDDHPPDIWGTTDQYQSFSHVELMQEGSLSSGTYAFLDPDTNYVAITDELVDNYLGYTFRGLLMMHNAASNKSYLVTCALKVSQGGQTTWHTVGTDTARVTHDGLMPPLDGPMYHHFDFGICTYNTLGEKIELVIDYGGASSDTASTYLYWDGHYIYSSSLHAFIAGSLSDRVVCEHGSGTHPAHPDTYWYDVRPANTRSDFHVRVYDAGSQSDYSGWMEPEGWSHAIHSSSGCGTWVSWYAPTSAESLKSLMTYRFGFVNDNPATWGEWTTTTGGSTNPHSSVADSSGAHGTDQDGYGARVHVPREPRVGSMPALTPLPDGGFEGDAKFDDMDGVIVVAICGETDSGEETNVYAWDGDGFSHEQSLEGISGAGSGCLAWGDYDDDGMPDLVISGMAAGGRITRVYHNEGRTLVWMGEELTGLSNASVAWADYDGDDDLELLTMGHDGTVPRAILYEHDGMHSFTVAGELVGLSSGSADWDDVDGDGDVDLLTTGSDGATRQTIFYLNDPVGTLTPVGDLGLPGVAFSDAEWCDYDRDGDPDLAFTGETGTATRMARVYRNDGGLVLSQVADVMSVYRSSCAWGDYNLDGDVDVAFCGYTGSTLYTRVYRNTGTGFTDSGFSFPGVREGALAFCDFDCDCDPDFFMVGADWSTKYAQPYENTSVVWVGVPDEDAARGTRLLRPNSPNPFNPSTTVRFSVPSSGNVELAVYDVRGRLVRALIDAPMTEGDYETAWDGLADDGRQVGSGVYLLRLVTSAGADTRKVVLLK